jgi:hypothetical protein
MAESLIDAATTAKQIIVYDKKSEVETINFLINQCPDFAEDLEQCKSKIHDVSLPFARKQFIHPKMLGKSSLKNVLDALESKYEYEDSLISNGFQASIAYENLWFSERNPEWDRRIKNELIAYCIKDALGQQDILHFFHSVSEMS